MNCLVNLNVKNKRIAINYAKDDKIIYFNSISIKDLSYKNSHPQYEENFPAYYYEICKHKWVIIFRPGTKTYHLFPGPYHLRGNEYPVKGFDGDENDANNLLKDYTKRAKSYRADEIDDL